MFTTQKISLYGDSSGLTSVIKLFEGASEKEEQFVLLPHGHTHPAFNKTNLSASVTSGGQGHTTT